MPNISVRGLEPDTLSLLKIRAEDEGASVNTIVLKLIRQGLGQTPVSRKPKRYTDLDNLKGSWGKEDTEAFDAATAPFGAVDPALWK
jgi:plasmid stability protein